MKKIIFILFLSLALVGCESRPEGFYATSDMGENAPALMDSRGYLFEGSGGKVRLVSQGIDIPYEVNGDKITINNATDILVLTLLDNGNLQYRGKVLKKEPASKAENPPPPQPAQYTGK